jgi:hypothetical protein
VLVIIHTEALCIQTLRGLFPLVAVTKDAVVLGSGKVVYEELDVSADYADYTDFSENLMCSFTRS